MAGKVHAGASLVGDASTLAAGVEPQPANAKIISAIVGLFIFTLVSGSSLWAMHRFVTQFNDMAKQR